MSTDTPPIAPSQDPFFVVGAVRSGTTLLRLMLGRHSMICACEEMNFVAQALVDPVRWPGIGDYTEYLQHNRNFLLSGYRIDPDLDFEALVNDFIRQRRALDGKPLFGAVIHEDYERLPRVWPTARHIHVVRDPRDTARSAIPMGWAGNTWGGAGIWLQAERSWIDLRGQLGPDAFMDVRYEDLVRDPKGMLQEICRFLRVPFGSGMIQVDENSTYEKPGSGVGRSWRNNGTPMEIRAVEARLGRMLADAGYEPSNHPPLRVGPARKLLLSMDDRIKRVRFAQKRFGMPLWAAAVLVRRLPFRSLHHMLHARIDAIINAHLK